MTAIYKLLLVELFIVLMIQKLCDLCAYRDVFRTMQNIHEENFLVKTVIDRNALNIFAKKKKKKIRHRSWTPLAPILVSFQYDAILVFFFFF